MSLKFVQKMNETNGEDGHANSNASNYFDCPISHSTQPTLPISLVHYPSFQDSKIIQNRIQYHSNYSNQGLLYNHQDQSHQIQRNASNQQNTLNIPFNNNHSHQQQPQLFIQKYSYQITADNPISQSPQSEAKPFLCKICPTAFARYHDLKRHAKKHDEIKAYTCTRCGKSFARKDSLSRHSKKNADGSHACKQMNATPNLSSVSDKALNNEGIASGSSIAFNAQRQSDEFVSNSGNIMYLDAPPQTIDVNRVESNTPHSQNSSIQDLFKTESDTCKEESVDFFVHKRRRSQNIQVDKSRQEYEEMYGNESHLNDMRIQIEFLKQELWKRDKLIMQLEKEKEILRNI